MKFSAEVDCAAEQFPFEVWPTSGAGRRWSSSTSPSFQSVRIANLYTKNIKKQNNKQKLIFYHIDYPVKFML